MMNLDENLVFSLAHQLDYSLETKTVTTKGKLIQLVSHSVKSLDKSFRTETLMVLN